MLRLLLVVLLAVAGLTGCKVIVIATAGGIVTSASGTYTCTPTVNCEIDVSNTDFNESFSAEADPGYVFVGWKLRERSFCGGRRDDCTLFFPGFLVDRLLPFVNSDQEFYLEAVFRELREDDGDIVAGNAMACYNPALMQQGTRFEAVYETVATGSPIAEQTIQDQFVDGNAVFDGQNAIQTTTDIQAGGVTSTSTSYATVDDARKRIYSLGSEVSDGLGGTSVTTFDPGQEFRFSMDPGQWFTQMVSVESTQQYQGQEFSSVSQLEQTTTFVGIQQITVGAGIFDACRFEITSISTINGQTFESSQTLWLAVDFGVLLRDTGEGFETSLSEGTLNGTNL